ncbi:MAG TPA: biotin--[acetyl-CoA-carboxylase] ligase [Vicinamibacterales bacterium]|nr:biotin--[acetyl-CoA-carboxylase] ligase [Vicinamibacterales bacterium]
MATSTHEGFAAEPIPDDIAAVLQSTAAERGSLGSRVRYFAEIGSTNDAAARAADRGEPDGLLIIAGAQTAGRGRLGRTWFSPPGAGIYASVILRDASSAPAVTLAGGVGVAEGVRRATGLPVEIKWPNDVVSVPGQAFSARRKLAGILAEASTSARGLQYVILGFGINLRAASLPPDLTDRATSLETELGRAVDGAHVLGCVLVGLHRAIEQVARGEVAEVLARWRVLAPSAHGAAIEWDTAAGVQTGVTAGLAADGALLARTASGVQRIVAGEVRWV